MRIVAVIQARMTSTRLPGKILMDLCGKSVLKHVIDRVSRIKNLDHICVAVPVGEVHDVIGKILPKDVGFVRGSESDVLSRFYEAAKFENADAVIRITSDCPFFDPDVASEILDQFLDTDVDYASNHFDQGYPLGFEVEIMKRAALEKAHREATDSYAREHVTPYLWQHPEIFSSLYVDYKPNLRHLRLVLDEEKDYDFTKAVYEKLYPGNPNFGFEELKTLFEAEPELLTINGDVQQKPLMRDTSS